MSEADIYEKLGNLRREVDWIKEQLAERIGMRQGEHYATLAPEALHPPSVVEPNTTPIWPNTSMSRFDK